MLLARLNAGPARVGTDTDAAARSSTRWSNYAAALKEVFACGTCRARRPTPAASARDRQGGRQRRATCSSRARIEDGVTIEDVMLVGAPPDAAGATAGCAGSGSSRSNAATGRLHRRGTGKRNAGTPRTGSARRRASWSSNHPRRQGDHDPPEAMARQFRDGAAMAADQSSVFERAIDWRHALASTSPERCRHRAEVTERRGAHASRGRLPGGTSALRPRRLRRRTADQA